MPRKRHRSTSADIRFRNMLESSGLPSMAGKSRLGLKATRPVGESATSNPPPGDNIPFLVAATDASAESKAAAAYQCDGTADDVQVAAAAAAASASGFGGRVVLSEGSFAFSSTVTLNYIHLHGAGMGKTVISTTAATGFSMDGYSELRGVYLDGAGAAGSVGVDIIDDHAVVEGCEIYNFETVIDIDALGTDARIANNHLFGGATTTSALSVGGDRAHVANNFIGYSMTLSADEAMVLDNRFEAGETVTVATGATRNMFAHNYLSGGVGSFSDSGTTTMRGTNFSNTGTW